jgi:predicted DNA-binding transcriptional regulator AlpA
VNKLAVEVAQLRELLSNAPLLHMADVLRRYGVSRSTVYNWLSNPRSPFPRPIRMAGPVWRLADLAAAEQAGQAPRPVSGSI